MRAEASLAEYFEAAQGWDRDRARAERASVRVAWWVAGIAIGLAVVAVAALAAVTPLKTVVPYLIRVDNTTGVVDVVPEFRGGLEPSQAVTRYLLTQYVTLRERYVPVLAEADYEAVGALQGAALNQAWAAYWNRSNPESPLRAHADGGNVRAQVTAVSFLTPASGRPDLAQVRFVLRSGVPGAETARQYVATLAYAYGAPSTDDRSRALNPLGFRVVEYRREPEVAPVTEPATASEPAP